MGKEIEENTFTSEQSARFIERVKAETEILAGWHKRNAFAEGDHVAGFELEAWLLDRNLFPLPRNEEYLARLNYPLVVPELSCFNVELNGTPQPLKDAALRHLEEELNETWRHCVAVAHDLEATMIMIGILPTIREQDLSLANISARNRYHALNAQILNARGGKPLRLDIEGRDHLFLTHDDVMLEAATTSFQVHMQTPASRISRHMNASMILSAPMVALSANSPFLFGKSLWAETRIPLFEQSVETGDANRPESSRVTFGSGYLSDDPVTLFRENIAHHVPLLPNMFDHDDNLPHMRLHNGTIWRWNRLLVGFDDARVPHMRIEHRPLPAGPTVVDMVSNAAVYLGATHFLAQLRDPPEGDLSFEQTKNNFYRAARDGLDARCVWLDGQETGISSVLSNEVLHMAREGLVLLGIRTEDIDRYLGIAHARVRSGQNGAAWQRANAEKNGDDFFLLTADYLAQQRSGVPVHEWPV